MLDILKKKGLRENVCHCERSEAIASERRG